jgi:hypothetical protein
LTVFITRSTNYNEFSCNMHITGPTHTVISYFWVLQKVQKIS